MRVLRMCLAAACVLALPLAARAQTFDISYAGTDSGYGFTVGTTTGNGSFTLTGGALSAFTFTLDQTAGPGETDVFTFGLSDLDGTFADTLTGGTITALSFMTDEQPGYYTPNTLFEVTDLLPGDADTGDFDVGLLTIGTLTVTPDGAPLPEPGSLAALSVGLLGLAAARWRAG